MSRVKQLSIRMFLFFLSAVPVWTVANNCKNSGLCNQQIEGLEDEIESIMDRLVECCPFDCIIEESDLAPDGSFVIDTPGSYKLNTPIHFSGSTGLNIVADNVFLDLGGNVISSSSNTVDIGVVAIFIGNANKNIEIHNGSCRDSGFGVSAPPSGGLGASFVHIHDMDFFNNIIHMGSNNAAFWKLSNVVFRGQGSQNNTKQAFGFVGANNMVMQNCKVLRHTVEQLQDARFVNIDSCQNCVFRNVQVIQNTIGKAGDLTANIIMKIDRSQNIGFFDSDFSNNTSINGNMTLTDIQGSANISFMQCRFDGNRDASVGSTTFKIFNSSQDSSDIFIHESSFCSNNGETPAPLLRSVGGVLCLTSTRSSVTNSLFKGNSFAHLESSIVELSGSEGALFQNNRILNNTTFVNIPEEGVNFPLVRVANEGSNISSNIIQGNDVQGTIDLFAVSVLSQDNLIQDNIIRTNGDSTPNAIGIRLVSSSNGVKGNVISEHKQGIVNMLASNNISANYVYNNESAYENVARAVDLQQSSDNVGCWANTHVAP